MDRSKKMKQRKCSRKEKHVQLVAGVWAALPSGSSAGPRCAQEEGRADPQAAATPVTRTGQAFQD